LGIDLTDPRPLYKQIAEEIKREIAEGRLKVGDSIGSHKELARRFNVSLITIRRARSELIQEGVLYTRIGKGTYVAEQTRRMKSTLPRTIGFVLRDLESPFFSGILTSVEKHLSEQDYNLLISSTANRSEKEESQIEKFLDMGVQGLIIASMTREYVATPSIRRLHQTGFPYAIVSFIADEDLYYVGIDHEFGGYLATRHLLKLGYKKIGYINGQKGSVLGEIRKKGYMRALAEFNIPYRENYVYHLRLRGEWFDYESGYEIGQDFIKLSDRPEAIFAYNDLAALGFEKAILDAGLKIPQDVAIVGFDDIKRSRVAPVPLSTIHQPTDEIGAKAVETVLNKIEGKEPPYRCILDAKLVVRDSCGAKLKSQKISNDMSKILRNNIIN